MMTKGDATKEKLMDIAEKQILMSGFSATSIDILIKEAGITKSGFFYHFDGKNDLACALMKRYREQDAFLFSSLFSRAEELTDDPLQQLLVFVKLLAEMMENIEGLHPGCLVASFTYELHEINEEVRAITSDAVKDWRRLFNAQIEKINTMYTPKLEANSNDLADMLTTIIEGGIVVSRAVNDPNILVRQLIEYRNYISVLYSH